MTFVYCLVPAGWIVALVAVVRDRRAQRTSGPKAPIYSKSTNEGVL